MQEKMKVLRVKAGLTQQNVADALGIQPGTYINWEAYRTFPIAPQLKKLAEVFNCKMDDIYFPEV